MTDTTHRKITLAEFREELKLQGVAREDLAFVCPMCGTVQSGRLLMKAKGTEDFEQINGIIGFSCIGRLTGKGSPSTEKGKGHGCNWTLGGLFTMNTLTVIIEDGTEHPHFELATPEQAVKLALETITGVTFNGEE